VSVNLSPVYIGKYGDTGIFRVDLAQSGLSSIQSVTIYDDTIISGGTGAVSGFDLDYVRISGLAVENATDAAFLAGDDVFNFGNNGAVLSPGYLQPWTTVERPAWNSPNLFGSNQNVYDQSMATLDQPDSAENGQSSISLGEGGAITFLLKSPVTTAGRYLYFGDSGGNDLASVTVSGDVAEPVIPGIELQGGSGDNTIVLGQGTNQHLGTGNDTVSGSAGRDVIATGAGDDKLYGYGGNDRLYGEAGNDILYGGTGNDYLHGGTGKDTFVFNTKPNKKMNVDRVADFSVKDDTIWMDNAIFKKVGKNGVLKKAAFWGGSEAHDATDRVIYDKKNGALYYDADGTGDAAQVKFATLSKNLKVTYKDFFVI
jgi:Ca2+-binding RTX toxin-like protein